jgi:hypothetical protein
VSTTTPDIDFDRLLRVRLVVGRHGEMDAGRWWNTGDAARRTALLGRAGSVLIEPPRASRRLVGLSQAAMVARLSNCR